MREIHIQLEGGRHFFLGPIGGVISATRVLVLADEMAISRLVNMIAFTSPVVEWSSNG